MSLLFALLNGIIQGLTEFLPVSSSGHLALLQNLFGFQGAEGNLTFTILLHVGTLIAVFLVFYRDIFALIPAFFTLLPKVCRRKSRRQALTESERMAGFVLLGSIPLLPAVLCKDAVEALAACSKAVGAILLLNGFLLFFSDRFAHGDKNAADFTPRNAFTVGLFQMAAIVPGLSRSGSTITGGLCQGASREFAVKLSFLLSIPAILGASVLDLPDFFRTEVATGELRCYLAGTAAAAVVGILAMKLLLYLSRKNNYKLFSYYCFAVGILAILFG